MTKAEACWQQACDWLWRQRQSAPADADVWDLRWQLRRGIARLADYFDTGGFERHPDKTQTGRIRNGFDWLGIGFGPEGAAIAPRALNNHRERRARLFEQARRRGMTAEAASERVRAYGVRWTTWAEGMLAACQED